MFENKDDNLIVKLPFGFRDIFPIEAEERKIIRGIIRKEFELWNYGEVKTPALEFTKNIAAGVGKDWKNKLISFFDTDGDLISLRADMTIPIARLAGMRLKREQLPARFYYFANSFRQSGIQKGTKRVYNQAGLELIGSSSFVSDIEVLTILINTLRKLGLKNFKIGLGHIQLIDGLCSWLNLNNQGREFIKNNLVLNNMVAIEVFLNNLNREKAKIFLRAIKPEQDIRKIESLISKIVEKKVKECFDYLKKVYNILDQLGYSKYLIIDLSIIREFNYYTGLLFEVYSPKITDLLGSGGRYDGLIKKFGLDVPATGFAMDIDLIHKSIGRSKLDRTRRGVKAILLGNVNNCFKLIQIVNKLHDKKISVLLCFDKDVNLEKIEKEKEYSYAYKVESDLKNITIIDLKNNKKQLKKVDDFLKD